MFKLNFRMLLQNGAQQLSLNLPLCRFASSQRLEGLRLPASLLPNLGDPHRLVPANQYMDEYKRWSNFGTTTISAKRTTSPFKILTDILQSRQWLWPSEA